jgi:hypothetical protein
MMAIPPEFAGTYNSSVTSWSVGPDPNPSGKMVIPDPASLNNIQYTIVGGTAHSVTPTIEGNDMSFSVGNYNFAGLFNSASETWSGSVDNGGNVRGVQNGQWGANKTSQRKHERKDVA